MIEYDPFADAVMRNPWPYYAQLRREAPVYYLERYDAWFLSKFEDIRASTTNDVFTAERGVTPEMVLLKAPPPPDPVFSMLDLPRQRDYRRMFAPRYTKNAIAAMEGSIRATTRELLAPLVRRGRFDVYRDLATPLAVAVIADLIGIPRDEAAALRARVARYFAREPGQIGTRPENEAERVAVIERLVELVSGRMAEGDRGGDDHVSVMLRTPAEGQPLSLGSMVATVYTWLVTGVEVTPLAVANTVLYLHRSPDQRQLLQGDPAQIRYAFDESLRYDQPTNLLGRFVKEPVEIRGQKLATGQGVMFLWSSGNRDEEEFPNADVFDVKRRPPRSLSFGHGAHKCIGEHLGRLEGCILLEEILAAAPEYAVDECGVERTYSEFLHGHHAVPIEFTPRDELPATR